MFLDQETKWYIRALEFIGEEPPTMSSNEEFTESVDNLHAASGHPASY